MRTKSVLKHDLNTNPLLWFDNVLEKHAQVHVFAPRTREAKTPYCGQHQTHPLANPTQVWSRGLDSGTAPLSLKSWAFTRELGTSEWRVFCFRREAASNPRSPTTRGRHVRFPALYQLAAETRLPDFVSQRGRRSGTAVTEARPADANISAKILCACQIVCGVRVIINSAKKGSTSDALIVDYGLKGRKNLKRFQGKNALQLGLAFVTFFVVSLDEATVCQWEAVQILTVCQCLKILVPVMSKILPVIQGGQWYSLVVCFVFKPKFSDEAVHRGYEYIPVLVCDNKFSDVITILLQ